MVGKKAHHVTNEILNAELSSLTKNQKKTLLGLVKAASGGMGVASVKVVKEPPTSTSQNISKKKKNANRTQIGGGGGGEGKLDVQLLLLSNPNPSHRRWSIIVI